MSKFTKIKEMVDKAFDSFKKETQNNLGGSTDIKLNDENSLNIIEQILNRKEIQQLINPSNDPREGIMLKQKILKQLSRSKELEQFEQEIKESRYQFKQMEMALKEELKRPTAMYKILLETAGNFAGVGLPAFFIFFIFALRYLFISSSIALLKLRIKIANKHIDEIHSFDTHFWYKSKQLLRHIQNFVARSPVLSNKESEHFSKLLEQWWNSPEGRDFLLRVLANPRHPYKLLSDDKIQLKFSDLVNTMIEFYKARNEIEAQKFLTTLMTKHEIYCQALEKYEKELESKREYSSFYKPVINAMSKLRKALESYFTDKEIKLFVTEGEEVSEAWLELERQLPFGMIVFPNVLEKVKQEVKQRQNDLQNNELIDIDMLMPKEDLNNRDVNEINFFEKNLRLMDIASESVLALYKDLFKIQKSKLNIENVVKNFGKEREKEQKETKKPKKRSQTATKQPENNPDFDYPIL